jgi:hypothetical protein
MNGKVLFSTLKKRGRIMSLRTIFRNKRLFVGLMGLAAMVLGGPLSPANAGQGTPQASVTLKNSVVAFCNVQENDWTLTKTNDQSVQPVPSPTDVTWTITATKTAGAKTICADGYMQVTNTGSAPATIGNIVVNLQRPRSGGNTGACRNVPWISAAADVADATNGNAATSANIVASASTEVMACNAAQGPPNYTVSGAQGTFVTSEGSGDLEFTDADSNSIWALTPQQAIQPGGTVSLFFSAKFDNDALGFADLQSLRPEVIVSFGNSGARGGSGSSASNIDVNGNGSVDTDEANVRSVPTRVTQSLPELFQCNDEVTLTDNLSADGTAGYDNISGDTFPVTTSIGGSWTVTATVTGGDSGGTVTNTANLAGEGQEHVLTYNTGQIDPITGLPIMAEKTFTCCVAADLTKESSVEVGAVGAAGPEFNDGDYCTNSSGDWPVSTTTTGPPPHVTTWSLKNFDATAFTSAFSSGLGIGYVGTGTLFDALWQANATGYANLPQAINGGTGTAGPLTSDLTNPTSMAGGSFTAEVATLALNVGFSGKNTTSGSPAIWPAGFGALIYVNPGAPLDGMTVAAILDAANDVAGQYALPSDYGFVSGTAGFTALGNLLSSIDGAFATAGANICKASQFAQDHLQKPK